MITGDDVKKAVLAAGITQIPHHECGICGEWVNYTVEDEQLYFNPGCECSWSPAEARYWSDAADWINMQSNEEYRAKIMQSFGLIDY